MNGIVDENLRALLEVAIGGSPSGPRSIVVCWVDTAFNGGGLAEPYGVERRTIDDERTRPAQQSVIPGDTITRTEFGPANEVRTPSVINDAEILR